MTNNLIFYTQLASILVFLTATFTLYRLLVDQKDSVIQLLKERLADKEAKILKLESQTPDAITAALSSRIEIALKEIARLREDDGRHEDEIERKEGELHVLKGRLTELSALIVDSDLICNKCGAPLSPRAVQPVYGHVGGHEVEADIEFVEYECGRALQDGLEVAKCPR